MARAPVHAVLWRNVFSTATPDAFDAAVHAQIHSYWHKKFKVCTMKRLKNDSTYCDS
jgi:hypothetical protein